MRKRDLEIALQKVPSHPAPKAHLEQYATPATIAADFLWNASARGDVAGLRVVDLGCGTGVLAIGAKLLGASEAFGFDVDEEAIEEARKAARSLGVDATFEARDVSAVDLPADTVLMNPPFGAQERGADRPFLDKAFELSEVVYTFLNAETEAFVRRFASDRGFDATQAWRYEFPLAHQFAFQEKAVKRVPVVALRLQARR